MKWLDLIKLILPIILQNAKVPHAEVIGPAVVHGISEAEALKGAPSSAEKLAHAVAITNVAIDAANASGANLDKAGINSALSDGISTAVEVTNLIHGK